MDSILGIVYATSGREVLRELTKIRTLAALPIAGKYRIIDFVLSGFVNSGIYDISIITTSNYHSLIDHLGSGKDWDLRRKNGGLRILTPLSGQLVTNSSYRGTLDALFKNLYSIKRSTADYVVITGSSIVCNIDYQEVLDAHKNKGADITCVYTKSMNGGKKVPKGAAVIKMDGESRITDLNINEDDLKDQDADWCLDMLILKKSLLETLTADAISTGGVDIYQDIIKRLSQTLNIYGYEFTGQFFEVSNIMGYMAANMNFLKKEYREKAFNKPIYTKVKDSVPTTYLNGCQVKNSLIADGCYIAGYVENSVISRGVKIERGASVKNCIIMQDTDILEGARVEYVIADKEVIVREGTELTGHKRYPVVLEKRSIV